MKTHHVLSVGVGFALILLACLVSGGPFSQAAPALPALDYPAPRYQKIPDITTVEQLLPYVRHVVQRPMPYTGDQRPGYGLKGGEKVLFVTDSDVDPLVFQAFMRVLRDEMHCQVDVLQFQGQRRMYRTEELMRYIVNTKPGPWILGGPAWVEDIATKGGYDKVIGQTFWANNNCTRKSYSFSMDWPTREQLASPAVMYPEEIIEMVDRVTWEILRKTARVRITDPEGTDVSFTWFDEYWQIMDGNFPGYLQPPTEGFGTHHYHHGALNDPIISGHIAGYPLGIVLPKSDLSGVVAGTSDHLGPYPHLKIYLKNNKVTKIEGGGEFGDLWRQFIERNKNVKFPHYPQPGIDYFVEAAIGTHPKVIRPFNVFESATARPTFIAERDRSGIIHIGIGQMLDLVWALKRELPFYHFHVHLYFPTYTCYLKDGREVNIIDKGRLTALDDPRVRQVAAKYGNPDELLREDWIPAIPGINTTGDYWKDYANDPESYMKQEHRRVYGTEIERSKKYYK
ncbi:MAG: hypothetical protein RMM98_01660 [Acidobacteriota bacterium]|nr:hypothetical protein [Blastocatellia bacterium]MDW8238293.1 hypothetical protein [Acidobacteriota bacterium]